MYLPKLGMYVDADDLQVEKERKTLFQLALVEFFGHWKAAEKNF